MSTATYDRAPFWMDALDWTVIRWNRPSRWGEDQLHWRDLIRRSNAWPNVVEG